MQAGLIREYPQLQWRIINAIIERRRCLCYVYRLVLAAFAGVMTIIALTWEAPLDILSSQPANHKHEIENFPRREGKSDMYVYSSCCALSCFWILLSSFTTVRRVHVGRYFYRRSKTRLALTIHTWYLMRTLRSTDADQKRLLLQDRQEEIGWKIQTKDKR